MEQGEKEARPTLQGPRTKKVRTIRVEIIRTVSIRPLKGRVVRDWTTCEGRGMKMGPDQV